MKRLALTCLLAGTVLSPAQAGPNLYSKVGWWSIIADHLDDGRVVCNAQANYAHLEINFSAVRSSDGLGWWIMMAHKTWKLEEEGVYPFIFDMPSGKSIPINFKGLGKTSAMAFVDKSVVNEFAQDKSGKVFRLRHNRGIQGIFKLDGSAAAIRSVVHCTRDVAPIEMSTTTKPPPNKQEENTESYGTGFFVAPAKVLTNHHVIDNCSAIHVRFGQFKPERAYIVGSDEQNDLALLSTTNFGTAEYATLRFTPKLGEPVAAYGYPLNDLLSPEGNFTLGNVTATSGMRGDTRFLQMSAQIQPGNSGGPVVDNTGRVIGVASGVLSSKKILDAAGFVPQNVNFAISSTVVAGFLGSKEVQVNTAGLGTKLDPEQLAAQVKKITVQVTCTATKSASK